VTTDVQSTIKAAMAVAKDVAEGRLLPSSVDAAALEACRGIVGVVVGVNDPLWPLQTEIARQVIAAGGIHANELSEWLAVQRRRDGPVTVTETQMEPPPEPIVVEHDQAPW
jgi:hypothetical protein